MNGTTGGADPVASEAAICLAKLVNACWWGKCNYLPVCSWSGGKGVGYNMHAVYAVVSISRKGVSCDRPRLHEGAQV